MEGSERVIQSNVDSLMKLVGALDAAGVELIGKGMPSQGGGRGVRLTEPTPGGAGPRSRKTPQMARARA
ncbi:hypothetical protein [Bosea sp. (in: a-proteobacteria)]|uniref:hypothetical protein n=1 Tax=Bosea sp. (in: a-proteobacteria) TaxID=1871050 RepID=UPI0035646CE3